MHLVQKETQQENSIVCLDIQLMLSCATFFKFESSTVIWQSSSTQNFIQIKFSFELVEVFKNSRIFTLPQPNPKKWHKNAVGREGPCAACACKCVCLYNWLQLLLYSLKFFNHHYIHYYSITLLLIPSTLLTSCQSTPHVIECPIIHWCLLMCPLSSLKVLLLVYMPSLFFRGFVYCRNEELEAGWVVHSNSYLLHRPVSFDTKSHQLCQVIDPYTLQVSSNIHAHSLYLLNILCQDTVCNVCIVEILFQIKFIMPSPLSSFLKLSIYVHFCLKVCQIVPMPPHHFGVGSSLTTLRVCSDGTYIYWVWSPVSLNEKTQKGHSVFMDVFQLVVGECYWGAMLSRL